MKKTNPYARHNDALSRYVRAVMGAHSLSLDGMGKIIGVSGMTLRRRLEAPWTFTVAELRSVRAYDNGTTVTPDWGRWI